MAEESGRLRRRTAGTAEGHELLRRAMEEGQDGDDLLQMGVAIIISAASFTLLYYLDFFAAMTHSPLVSRGWFDIGLLLLTAQMSIVTYLEVFRSMMLGEKLEYENARTSSQLLTALILACSIVMLIALWPLWGWLTPVVLAAFSWGTILQLSDILPQWAWRAFLFAAYFWFMHNYLQTHFADAYIF
eukprot:PLAT9787.1.p3 GENE.PLAT9787.1~~PLAT9787.1.p3  ORF type:complete len:187 (+),score=98.75 PLAT9787.1:646-1206(+)